MDRVKQRSNALYGVIEWSPGDKNFLTIGHRHQYQIVRGAPRKGASRYSKLTFGLDPNTGEVIEKWINAGNTPPSFNNGANWAFDKQKTENSFIEYKHFFSPDFSLQASYNRTHYKTTFSTATSVRLPIRLNTMLPLIHGAGKNTALPDRHWIFS